jgi:NADH-quinone oxidoreductase subunit E
LAACGGAPMMQVDHKYYENLSKEKIDKIIKDIEND